MELTAGGGVVLRRWRTIAIVAMLGALIALLATFVLPQKYQASSSLLVHASDVRLFNSVGQTAAAQDPFGQTAALVQTIDETQIGLLTSRPIAEQVVQELHLDHPKPPANWFAAFKQEMRQWITVALAVVKYGYYKQPAPYEGAVENVQHSVTAKAVGNSYILDVTATAGNPDDAAAIANTASKAFIAYYQGVYGDQASSHSQFVNGELTKAQQSVAQAQAALAQYQQEHHLPAIATQIQLDATTANTARQTLQQNDADLAAAQARLSSLNQQVKATSPTIQQTQSQQGQTSSSSQGGDQTVTQNGAVHSTGGATTINQDNSNSVADHSTTQTLPNTTAPAGAATAVPAANPAGRFGASTGSNDSTSTTKGSSTQRSVTAPSDTTSDTTQHIVSAPTVTDQKTALTQTSTISNPVYEQLVVAQAKAQQDVAAMQAQHQTLTDALGKVNDTLNAYPAASSDLAMLQLQVDAATNTYLKLRSDYEDALITQAQAVNDLSIVDVAVPPTYPVKPLKFLYFLIGLVVGTVGGTGVGFWQDWWSRSHVTARRSRRARSAAPNLGRGVPDLGSGAAISSDGGAT